MTAMAVSAVLLTGVLADNGPQNTGPDFGKASPFGLIVIVLLLIAVFGLVWSMNRHLRRVPKSFGPDEDEAVAEPTVDGPGTGVDTATDTPADGTKREPD
jgi:hypothetical protein